MSKSDQHIWSSIYGTTLDEVDLIARQVRLTQNKVTRVIELAHSLQMARPAPHMNETSLLSEDHTEIRLVAAERREMWTRRADPWKVDHRRTCRCSHRYGIHAKSGTSCLAANDDRPGGFCGCQGWEPND